VGGHALQRLADPQVACDCRGDGRCVALCRDQPETFEVPDINLDMPGMELFAAPPPPSPGPMPLGEEGELFPVPEGLPMPDNLQAAGDAEQPRSTTPEPSAGKVSACRPGQLLAIYSCTLGQEFCCCHRKRCSGVGFSSFAKA
jgi:hypothetical protein